MKTLMFIAVVTVALATCSRIPSSVSAPAGSPDPNINVQMQANSNLSSEAETNKSEKITQEFQSFDFRNFVYHSLLTGDNFRLSNGEFDSGDQSHWYASYGAASYADLTGDGKQEAIVEIWEATVGGSTHGTFSYYVFSARASRPRLIGTFSTGSEADCGHKSIAIEEGTIVLEVFGICCLEKMSSENYDTDVNAKNFTRLVLRWNGKRFIQASRDVFPYPQDNISSDLYKHTLERTAEQQSQ
jgi:hypothetical protein